MTDQTANHYLRIYRTKLGMAEDGTTHPAPAWVSFMRTLVAELERLDPNALVHLEASDARTRFTDVITGSVLAEFEFPSDV